MCGQQAFRAWLVLNRPSLPTKQAWLQRQRVQLSRRTDRMGASPRPLPAVVVLFDASDDDVRLHVEASTRGVDQGLASCGVRCEVIPLQFVDDHVSMENMRWRSILTADAVVLVSAALGSGPSERMRRFLANSHFAWGSRRAPLVSSILVCPEAEAAHGTLAAQHAMQLWAAANGMRWMLSAGCHAGFVDLASWRGACVGLGACIGASTAAATAGGSRVWDE
jgi:hypothetical protein